MSDAIEVAQIEKTYKSLWNEFVCSATEGNIFQTFEWAEVMKKAGYGEATCLVMKKNDEIIAGILLMTRTYKGRIMPFISSSESREGPIIKDGKISIDPLLNTIERCFSNRSLVTIDMPFYPFRSSSRDVFNNFNYDYTPSCTFLINLADSLDELWGKLEKRARWSVKKAEESGVYVETLSDEEDLKKYYELYLEICQRTALGPYTYNFLRTVWYSLKREDKVKIFVVKHNEEMAAGATVLLHKDKMWYWSAVSNARLRKLHAPSLLLWSIIEAGHEKGFHLLDLCGAMCNPDPAHLNYGPDIWKRGFGGKRVELGRQQKIFHSTFRGLWNRLVIPIERALR